MGEGFLKSYAGDRFEAYSAGVDPTKVNPKSIQVMHEVSIDISNHTSDSVEKYQDVPFDYVITVCNHAQQTCPVLAGDHKKIHWDLEDPAKATGTEEEILDFFRATRDEISQRIKQFLAEEKEF